MKSSSSFRKRAPVKEPDEDQKQVPNSNGGAVCSYNQRCRTGILSTRGEASQQRIMSSKNHVFRHAKKTCFATHTGLISLGVSDTCSKAHMSGSCSSNSLPIQLASKNTTNSKSSQKNAQTAPPSCKPHVIWSDEGQSKWNDITTTNTTLVELDFFLSPLWEHFGSQMGWPDLFGDLD